MPQAKTISIFRPGRHVAMSGEAIDFSDDDVEATAAAYDPKLHEAPLVIGHPKHDAPAWGWVSGLSFGETLEASPAQVDPAFAEMVEAGRFKKISASFYPPSSPSNPVPGVFYLRHVGFLGAQPPSVKGLPSAEFAEDADIVTIEFSERERWGFQSIGRMLRNLRDKWIEKDGIESADQVLPGYLIEDVERAAEAEPEPQDESLSPLFSEPQSNTADPAPTEQEDLSMPDDDRSAEFAERESAIEQREQEIAEREAEIAREDAERARQAAVDFSEQLVNEGRILPRDRDGVVELLSALPADQNLEFGEGDAAFSGTSAEWLRDFLSRLPVQVDFSEIAAPEAGDEAPVDFAAPEGYAVDPAAMAVHKKAVAYQRQHPDTPYAQAVDAVSGQ